MCEKEKHPTTPHQPTAASRGRAAPAPARAHWLAGRRCGASIGGAGCQSGAGRRARRRGRGGSADPVSRDGCGVAAVPAIATFNRQQCRCSAAAGRRSERPAASARLLLRPRPCQQERGARAAGPRGLVRVPSKPRTRRILDSRWPSSEVKFWARPSAAPRLAPACVR